MKPRLIAAAFVAAVSLTPCASLAQPKGAPSQVNAPTEADVRLQRLEVAEAGRAAVAERIADERTAADLLAQQQMAASARHLAGLTLLQVLIAAAGTFVLVVTIRQANQSMKLSSASLDQNGQLVALTQRHAEMQLKAYLDKSKWVVEEFDTAPHVIVDITNRGQTPARNVDLAIEVELLDPLEYDPQWKEIPEGNRLQVVNSLVPNAVLRPGRSLGALTPEQKQAFADHSLGIWLRGVVTFEDVFGGKYRQRFSGVFFGANAGRSRMSRFGNDEVELPTT